MKNIIKYGKNIEVIYNNKKLSEPELMNIKELKCPILRLKLLEKLLDNKNIFPQILKREYSSLSTKETYDILQNSISINILKLIAEMVEKPEINSFINLIK